MTRDALDRARDTVLIVTSHEKLAREIIFSLGPGYAATRAANATEAFSFMTFQRPGVIIADSDLPEKSGIEFLHNIRGGYQTKLIPFIMISRKDNTQQRIRAIEAGADAYLKYPFLGEELRAFVASKLHKYREFYLLSITDELTRLYNRKEFIKKFNDETDVRNSGTIALAILDLDFFKRVNDLYGHQMGDQVLQKLAEMLRGRSSSSFFPARFGGEEFVILFPGFNTDQAKVVMERLLHDFSLVPFKTEKTTFYVTFSAGIAEYPAMASNISELLSRSDQALYAAKEDGRNRIYSFSPIMARNDKFWEYLRSNRGVFIDSRGCDSITKLPYLPQLLETVVNLDFELNSIGVLVIRFRPLFDFEKYFGTKNYYYDIENISIIIQKSIELIFPTDMYVGHSDIFDREFLLLFPSIIDFTLNTERFNEICREICTTIQYSLSEFSMNMECSFGIIPYERMNPHGMYRSINAIRGEMSIHSDKSEKFINYLKTMGNGGGSEDLHEIMEIKNFYSIDLLEPLYQYPALKEPLSRDTFFSAILEESITGRESLGTFLVALRGVVPGDTGLPLLLPWISSISFDEYVDIAAGVFGERELVILINESGIPAVLKSGYINTPASLPGTVSIGLDNCFIGADILGYLSIMDFRVCIFSENISRKLHHFKDRIKIISGLILFLDQVGIPALARNVQLEEEYHILRDLHISCAGGAYLETIREGIMEEAPLKL
ncbi:MAG: hypothetical protein CVV44_09080 [Spirochaetae bacterium HGW-Spirochaetae-1]|jgi:diguanylate cyclase (GGDEF)-like protein|nr:MAG: hypothetical protein CVV44_09080 [Spirochaetae bacterium HGW-Spirochaetae-1]